VARGPRSVGGVGVEEDFNPSTRPPLTGDQFLFGAALVFGRRRARKDRSGRGRATLPIRAYGGPTAGADEFDT